jgi:hypothetical protein
MIPRPATTAIPLTNEISPERRRPDALFRLDARLGWRLASLLWIALVAAAPVQAAPPAPLGSDLWAFPAELSGPASAASAGLAMADRWLGEQPFDNPAIATARGGAVSGLLQHVSRQDLRAKNRQFDEQAAFLDGAGAWFALPLRGITISAHAFQPVLRLEDNAFARGETGGPVPPAVVLSTSTARELHAGLAVSAGVGPVHAGVGGEWVRRDDAYEVTEKSDAPESGVRRVDFSGDGFGVLAGVRIGADRGEAGAFTVGAGLRYLAPLDVNGEQSFQLLEGDSLARIAAKREAAWEGGVSASFRTTAAFRLVTGVGIQRGRDWTGFDLRTGTSTVWSIGGEFHDDLDPWTLRFGGGLEQQSDVAERRAGIFGLGIGWELGQSVLDFGVTHRTLDRAGSPTSYDDRVVVTLSGRF